MTGVCVEPAGACPWCGELVSPPMFMPLHTWIHTVPECGEPTILGGTERPCQMLRGHKPPHLRRPEPLSAMGRPR